VVLSQQLSEVKEQPEGNGNDGADSGGGDGGGSDDHGGNSGGRPEDMDLNGTPEGQGEEGCCVCRRPLHIKDTDMGCECEVCGCSAHKASCWRGMCRLCSDEQQRPWRPSKFNEDCPVCGLVLTAEVPMAQCLRCKQWGCYPLCINGFCREGLDGGPCWEAGEEPLPGPGPRGARSAAAAACSHQNSALLTPPLGPPARKKARREQQAASNKQHAGGDEQQVRTFVGLQLTADAAELAAMLTEAAEGLTINGSSNITLSMGKKALEAAGFTQAAKRIKDVKGPKDSFTSEALLLGLDKLVGSLLAIWEGPESSGLIAKPTEFLEGKAKDKRTKELEAKEREPRREEDGG